MNANILISRIEAYAKSCGLAPATITGRAVGNSRLYSRLVGGGSCSLSTAEKLVRYLDRGRVHGSASCSVGFESEVRA